MGLSSKAALSLWCMWQELHENKALPVHGRMHHVHAGTLAVCWLAPSAGHVGLSHCSRLRIEAGSYQSRGSLAPSEGEGWALDDEMV